MEQDTEALIDRRVAQASQAPLSVITAPSGAKIGQDRQWYCQAEPWYSRICHWSGWGTCLCDPRSWGSFLLSFLLPFMGIGWNRHRVFPKYAVPWGIAAILCFAGAIIFPLTISEDYCTGYYYPYEYYCSDEGYDASWCWEKQCRGWKRRPKKVACVLMGICVLIMLGMGYINRIQLRKKFGLPGNAGMDLLLWIFCGPCSLYQETRTLWHNRVVNGVWQGPHQMTTTPIQQMQLHSPSTLPTCHRCQQQYLPTTLPFYQYIYQALKPSQHAAQPSATELPVMDLAPQQNQHPYPGQHPGTSPITQDAQDTKPSEDDSNGVL